MEEIRERLLGELEAMETWRLDMSGRFDGPEFWRGDEFPGPEAITVVHLPNVRALLAAAFNGATPTQPSEQKQQVGEGPPELSSEEATALVGAYFGEDHDAKSADAAIKRLGDWLDGVYDASSEIKRPFEDEGFAPDTPMPERRRPTQQQSPQPQPLQGDGER